MYIITQAKLFATQKHVLDNHQVYGNVLPYTHHLQAVAEKLIAFGERSETSIAAAWLHDVVEDTAGRNNEVRVRDIEEIFGEEIALLVSAVTSEPGANRKVRNALTYPKIRATGYAAIELKLADRLANVEFSISGGGRAIEMYRKEHADFRHGLYLPWAGGQVPDNSRPLEARVYEMWNCLDNMISA